MLIVPYFEKLNILSVYSQIFSYYKFHIFGIFLHDPDSYHLSTAGQTI